MQQTTPPRLIVDNSQVIVVLDTNPARNLAEMEVCPSWVSTFAAMSTHGYSFSLAEEAFTELAAQRTRESISESNFKRMCERLRSFINPEFPVIPGGRDLLGMLQINRSDWTEESCRALSLEAWDFLVHSIDDPCGGDRLHALLNEARDEWIDRLTDWQSLVDDIKNKGRKILECTSNLSPEDLIQLTDSIDLTKHYLAENSDNPHESLKNWVEKTYSWHAIEPKMTASILQFFDETSGKPLPDTVGMHLEVRYHWQQFSRMQKEKRPYNPSNKRNYNDGIDYYLYSYLKLPAFIVTEDNGFFSRLVDIDSYQKNWIHKPDGLAQQWINNKNPKPSYDQRYSVYRR